MKGRRIAGALLALGIGLALCELAARTYAALTLRERGHAFDPDVGWRPLPNVRKKNAFWGANEPAFTNARGLRDGEHAFERPNGTKRILVLGDSFTFGAGVDYGERFTELLEHEGREVINLGVNAYGTDQELRLYELDGVRYEADLVLLVTFLGNDLEDIKYERRGSAARPHFELDGETLRFFPAREGLTTGLRRHSYLAEMLMTLVDRAYPTDVPVPAWKGRSALPLYVALVERLHRAVAARGSELLVVLAYPTWDWGEPLGREVGSALAARDLEILDTRAAFLLEGEPNAELYLPDMHWTPEGHAVLARLLEAVFAERGL